MFGLLSNSVQNFTQLSVEYTEQFWLAESKVQIFKNMSLPFNFLAYFMASFFLFLSSSTSISWSQLDLDVACGFDRVLGEFKARSRWFHHFFLSFFLVSLSFFLGFLFLFLPCMTWSCSRPSLGFSRVFQVVLISLDDYAMCPNESSQLHDLYSSIWSN